MTLCNKFVSLDTKCGSNDLITQYNERKTCKFYRTTVSIMFIERIKQYKSYWSMIKSPKLERLNHLARCTRNLHVVEAVT